MDDVRQERVRDLERLYVHGFERFVRVARAIVGDRERALEAVQDGFADAVRGCASFRGDGPFEGWVWQIVLNAARKAARRPLIEGGVRGGGMSYELPPLGSDVAPLVSALPERQRLVVFLRYYADLDYRSIATAIGVEVGTVAATLAAAHAAVRRAMEDEKEEVLRGA